MDQQTWSEFPHISCCWLVDKFSHCMLCPWKILKDHPMPPSKGYYKCGSRGLEPQVKWLLMPQFRNPKAERRGSILKTMLSKFEAEHSINNCNYRELQEALWWCTEARNSCSLRKGYAPEALVLGKHSDSQCSQQWWNVSSSPLSRLWDSSRSPVPKAVGHERMRTPRIPPCRQWRCFASFHSPERPPWCLSIQSREWVMVWRPGKGSYPGAWAGPMKVVVQESRDNNLDKSSQQVV